MFIVNRDTWEQYAMVRTFKQMLRDGERLVGTMVTMPTATSAEILADSGFDWLMIDCEHGLLELHDVLAILQAVGHRIPCIVRVPASDDVWIKKVMDLGASGIVVPQVNSAACATEVVQSAKYAPDGKRGVGLSRAQGYGARFQEYLATANAETTVIIQAEDTEAVANIQEIVSVPGIDAVFLGPYDLSASLGRMGKVDDPVVLEAIQTVINACNSAGVTLGCFGVSCDAVRSLEQQGCRLIAVSTDAMFLSSAAKQTRASLGSKKT